ncbi:hypothetical protein ACET3Z_025716 [Daucus carota]
MAILSEVVWMSGAVVRWCGGEVVWWRKAVADRDMGLCSAVSPWLRFIWCWAPSPQLGFFPGLGLRERIRSARPEKLLSAIDEGYDNRAKGNARVSGK